MFRSQYTKLKAAIQSPEVVVDELFAKGSIEFGVKEKVHLHTRTTSEKCEILLCAVRQKIIVDPNEFHVFISILQKEPATKNIADRLLRRKYNKNLLANLTERTIKIWHIGHSHAQKLCLMKVLKANSWGLLFLLGSYTVISCVAAVGVALLLLSVVDVRKLKFGLALYCITAGVGAITLAVVIQNSWVAQSLSNTDKRDWKLEQLQHSRLSPEKGRKSTDLMDAFSLPQCI